MRHKAVGAMGLLLILGICAVSLASAELTRWIPNVTRRSGALSNAKKVTESNYLIRIAQVNGAGEK